ncbi:unnamed protein product [Rotaria sordida]|uniref:Palmitoyltransferase n=1 Tax=Rotaria sordida TaxID=392033 RepID=A0A818X702_9BILA|nr:unnamed protein product [Rotaria sordida]CAF3733475.1 unnamed protein product [Rotaria sordida]
MSFARLLPANNNNNDDDDDETNSLSETGVIVKDIVPRSMVNDDDCTCTCACCPTISDWCIKDAFGLSCGIMTWIFFLYGEFVFVFVILTPKTYSLLFYWINFFIFHLLEFLAISSHFRTMFSNPGAVPLKNATRENLLRYENGTIVYRCAMCQSIKPPRAHHCSVCKRCIKRMDHHCVFVNNCVGQNNQKYFILFTFYTFILTIYGLFLLGIHITTCIPSNWTACPAWPPPVTLLFMISFGLEGLSFLAFTGVMTCTQLCSIYTDTNQIELFKGVTNLNRERNSFIYSLKIVFGSRIGLTWLNPFSKPIYLITQNDERIIFDI